MSMSDRAIIIASCWFAIALISIAYMYLFRDIVGDVLFGVFLPVGLLVFIALAVTFAISSGSEK